jgi:hypothetical protein
MAAADDLAFDPWDPAFVSDPYPAAVFPGVSITPQRLICDALGGWVAKIRGRKEEYVYARTFPDRGREQRSGEAHSDTDLGRPEKLPADLVATGKITVVGEPGVWGDSVHAASGR